MFYLNTIAIPPEDPRDEDAELVSEAQKNPAAFSWIYERWEVPVYQYFYYRTGDAAAAEDLTSQLFLAVFQSIRGYKHRGHFAAWLFTIARNLVARYHRKKHREEFLNKAAQMRSSSDPLEELTASEEIEHLKQLVRSLPSEDQELIRLRYAAGLKFGDISILLHKREDTVKKSLYRLQARLQNMMERNDD
jgi:RNA polymerase sigma-70 factor, ECF subfamily